MKRTVWLGLLLLLCSTAPVLAAEDIRVEVDGTPITFDQPPVIRDDRLLVPLRAIFEALGARVSWDEETQSIYGESRLRVVSLQIGQKELYRDGEAIPLDVPAQIINDRTMVPARAIAEALDAEVDWNPDTRLVQITSRSDGAYHIRDQFLTHTTTAPDGTEVMTVRYAYPQFENPSGTSGITQINQTLENEAKTAFQNTIDEYATTALTDYETSKVDNYPFRSYTFINKFDVPYNTQERISIVMQDMADTGGAHPNTFQFSQTYDTATGKELSLTDIFSDSPTEANTIVKNAFTALIQAEPDTFFPDAAKDIPQNIDEVGFYLTADGVVLYVNPYLLAPYAAGIISLEIPLS